MSDYFSTLHENTGISVGHFSDITASSSATAATLESLARNVVKYGTRRDIDFLRQLEQRMNSEARSSQDIQSNLTEIVSQARQDIEVILKTFIERFWVEIKRGEIGEFHRFRFTPYSACYQFQHEHQQVGRSMQQGLRVGRPMDTTPEQTEACSNLETYSKAIGPNHVVSKQLGRNRVECTKWEFYYDGSEFVCEFVLDM
jgi:hypothetical protein